MKLARASVFAAAAIMLACWMTPAAALAQQRTPLDGDAENYIADYCGNHYADNFKSEDECTYYVSNHYTPPQEGDNDGGSYFIFLPNGDYKTYHLI